MYSWIFGGLGVLLALIFVGVGALKGRKMHRTYSWMRLAATAVALVLSVLFAVLLARGLSSVLMKVLLRGDLANALAEAPIFKEFLAAMAAMILAPLLFFWLFLIVKGILNFVVRRIARAVILKQKNEKTDAQATESESQVPSIETVRKKQKKFSFLRSKKNDGISAVYGALCGVLIFFAFMVPLMGTVVMADSAMHTVGVLANNKTVDTVESITDSASNNVGAKIFRTAGGDLTYQLLTTQKIEKESVCLVEEIQFLSEATETVVTVLDAETTPTKASEELLELEQSFDKTAMIPTLLPNVLSSANEKWDAGKSFVGIKKPFASSSTAGVMLDPMLHRLAEADADTIREDCKTVIEMMAILAKNDALRSIRSNPTKIVNDEELTASLLCEVFENDHMCMMIEEIADGGLSVLGQKMGVNLGKIHLHMQNVENSEEEAEAFAHAIHCSLDVFSSFKKHASFDADMIRAIGPMMDALSHTALVGDETATELMRSLLASNKVRGTLGFSQDETEAIVDVMAKNSEEGYTNMMNSVGQSIEVVQMATQAVKDPATLDKKVGELLEGLTPASSEVLKVATTPSLMESKGVPTHSSEATSQMLTSMFDNLTVAKQDGMTEEQYQKEASATANMINMAMSAKQSGTKELFGEGSATGKSADAFVDEIFESDIILQTMVETVYTEEKQAEPTLNPLGTKRQLKENEKTDILAALNNQWENASEEQRADEEYQKQFVALGAMVNLPLEFTENGIVDMASLPQLPSIPSVTE